MPLRFQQPSRPALALLAFSLASCAAPAETEDAQPQVDWNYRDLYAQFRPRSIEALHTVLLESSLLTPVSAALISTQSIDFGTEMRDLYQSCYQPPRCPEQDLPVPTLAPFDAHAKRRRTDLREMTERKACYPNAVFEKKDDRTIVNGTWITGLSKVDVKGQEAARLAGTPVTHEAFAPDSGVDNAARHSVLYCYMAGMRGYDKVKAFADTHEEHDRDFGLEDTWADYWNNEIGMRFGARLHRLTTEFKKSGKEQSSYRGKLKSGMVPFHGTSRAQESLPADIIDLTSFRLLDGWSGFRMFAPDSTMIMNACKRYLEGVLLGAFSEQHEGRMQPVRLMTHIPSLSSRLRKKDFFPLLGQAPGVTTRFLASPGRYALPTATWSGFNWINAEPGVGDARCLATARQKALYLKPSTARAAPWAGGDPDLVWPAYRPERDRFQAWGMRRP